jgi:hypothetical protein
MGVIGYLNVAMFLGCAGVTHPFRGFSTLFPHHHPNANAWDPLGGLPACLPACLLVI